MFLYNKKALRSTEGLFYGILYVFGAQIFRAVR